MLETKCFDDNFKLLVTILSPTSSIFLTLASGTNIQKMSRRLKFCYQYQNCNHHYVTNITVTTDTSARNGTKRSLQTLLAIQGPCITDRSTLLVPLFATNCIRVSKDFENFSKNVRRMYNFESFKKILKLV